jgi:hypothetical protein
MKKENRTRRLITRFMPEEFAQIEARFKKTMFQNLSEYCRELLLERPVTIVYRDRSSDDLLEELALLRRELNAVGNNLNQAMRNINSAHGHAENRLWVELFTIMNDRLEPSIGMIRSVIGRYAAIWSAGSQAEKA